MGEPLTQALSFVRAFGHKAIDSACLGLETYIMESIVSANHRTIWRAELTIIIHTCAQNLSLWLTLTSKLHFIHALSSTMVLPLTSFPRCYLPGPPVILES